MVPSKHYAMVIPEKAYCQRYLSPNVHPSRHLAMPPKCNIFAMTRVSNALLQHLKLMFHIIFRPKTTTTFKQIEACKWRKEIPNQSTHAISGASQKTHHKRPQSSYVEDQRIDRVKKFQNQINIQNYKISSQRQSKRTKKKNQCKIRCTYLSRYTIVIASQKEVGEEPQIIMTTMAILK